MADAEALMFLFSYHSLKLEQNVKSLTLKDEIDNLESNLLQMLKKIELRNG